MQNLIQLNILKPDPWPKLSTLMDENLLINHLAIGNIEQLEHPDKNTRMFNYTQRCERENAWDAVTLACNGLIVRDNRVLARPYAKVFARDTAGLPETQPEFFPKGAAEVTDMLDGVQAVVYEDMRGLPQIATRHGFVTSASLWAAQWYRQRYRNALWPDGYTPVFQIVGPKWRRVVEYREENLYLVALVRNLDGMELTYGDVSDWAAHNDMPMVEYFPFAQEKALKSVSKHRGFVFKWNTPGGPPLRVSVDATNYGRLQHTMEAVTPIELWKLLSEGAQLDGLKHGVGEEFGKWIVGWERRLITARDMAELEARRAVQRLGVDTADMSTRVRANVIGALRSDLETRPWLLAVAIAVLDDRNPTSVERYAWQAAKREAMGQKGFVGV